LLEVALRWGAEVHQAFHARHRSRCTFTPTNLILDCWRDRSQPPHETFRVWAAAFVTEFERTHESVAASRARIYVEKHYDQRLILPVVARELGYRPTRLARDFRRAFGISLSDYQRQIRVLESVRLLRGTSLKIEAVAYTVGYRSKKDFYRATRTLMGMTPAAIRRRGMMRAA